MVKEYILIARTKRLLIQTVNGYIRYASTHPELTGQPLLEADHLGILYALKNDHRVVHPRPELTEEELKQCAVLAWSNYLHSSDYYYDRSISSSKVLSTAG